ncbi:RDD family protein [Actinomadura madurae]|uniref:RDD family protein n=1 Tax=Actinomadura madurae TaxID=1993 RepID=UPI000D865CA4|nr:RDD family protein [Actinomadura madurae]SPT50477.1 RDD family [Actinomadura madurae]
MSEPPKNPPPEGDRPAPEPASGDTNDSGDAATPERPPPYQGTYGGQPAQPPPAAGSGRPGGPLPQAPPVPGYGPPGVPQPGAPYPGGPYPGGPQDMLAGRGARLGAGILDSILISVVAMPAVLFSIRWDKMQESVESNQPITDPMDVYNIPRLLTGYAIVFVLSFAYFTVLHAKTGQTLGKKACGIRLVKASDQSAVTWGQVIGRQGFIYAISITTGVLNLLSPAAGILGIVGLLDVAWILWDDRRQALHDKVAKTIVVKATPWTPNPYARDAAPGPGNG